MIHSVITQHMRKTFKSNGGFYGVVVRSTLKKALHFKSLSTYDKVVAIVDI